MVIFPARLALIYHRPTGMNARTQRRKEEQETEFVMRPTMLLNGRGTPYDLESKEFSFATLRQN
jgi:hypothetical protein